MGVVLDDGSMSYCWFGFEDGHHTCMLPTGHDGPHEPTPDSDIVIRLIDPPRDTG